MSGREITTPTTIPLKWQGLVRSAIGNELPMVAATSPGDDERYPDAQVLSVAVSSAMSSTTFIDLLRTSAAPVADSLERIAKNFDNALTPNGARILHIAGEGHDDLFVFVLPPKAFDRFCQQPVTNGLRDFHALSFEVFRPMRESGMGL